MTPTLLAVHDMVHVTYREQPFIEPRGHSTYYHVVVITTRMYIADSCCQVLIPALKSESGFENVNFKTIYRLQEL